MGQPIDLALLRSFVAVVETGSVMRAANRVGRSQSAVSMQLQRLEADVGRALFRREGRSLRVNGAGEELLLYARRLLRLSDEALASLRRPEHAGLVRLGMPEDYAVFVLPALEHFSQAYPLAEIELTFQPSTALLHQAQTGQIDLAVITRDPTLALPVLRRERFIWAASPEHAVWLRDPVPVALFEAGDLARMYALEALQENARPFRAVCSSKSQLGLIAVARAGLAVSGIVESCLPTGLVCVGADEGLPDLPPFEISLAARDGPATAIGERLHAFLMRELAREAPGG